MRRKQHKYAPDTVRLLMHTKLRGKEPTVLFYPWLPTFSPNKHQWLPIAIPNIPPSFGALPLLPVMLHQLDYKLLLLSTLHCEEECVHEADRVAVNPQPPRRIPT